MARNHDCNGDPCGEYGAALREVDKLRDDVARFRLTDEEREAIYHGAASLRLEAMRRSRLHQQRFRAMADTLERLLERLPREHAGSAARDR